MKNQLKILKALVLSLLVLSSQMMMAQEETAEKPVKKSKARISLDYTIYNNTGPRLTATVKTKIDRSYVNVPDVKVNFYIDSISKASRLGETLSNENGEAIFLIPQTLTKRIAKDPSFEYFVTISDNDRLKDAKRDIEVKRSFFEMNLKVEDSVKKVQVFVGAPDSTGEIVPVEDIEVKVYVKRLFGELPITEGFETTNAEGIMETTFPDDIPGDETGNLMILAKVEEHDEYGTLIVAKKIAWGLPLTTDPDELKGELWSARNNAPQSLVVIINGMIIAIWGVILYIFLQILKIKRIGKA